MSPEITNFGREYLQNRISGEFELARHIGIVVESADDGGVVMRAPLAPNANYKGTAFGGSLYSLAVLTGWAWVTRYLAARGLSADAVIQESSMRFLAPVHGELRARVSAPADTEIDKFRKMLQRAGRGRIRLRVQIDYEQTLATLFEGVFAAAIHR
ncbi:MAG TPA: YiiD C-terminal domain-containing protein [Steroidobacteraceae bacterium]|nr:YiiD C-terminal domain-containing protein [Steroidobacteraceae bacterium]